MNKIIFKILIILIFMIIVYAIIYLLLGHFQDNTVSVDLKKQEIEKLEIVFPKEYVCLYYQNNDGQRITIHREMIFYSPYIFIVSNHWVKRYESIYCDGLTLDLMNKKIPSNYRINMKDVKKKYYYDMDNSFEMRMDVLETNKGFFLILEIIK